MSKRISFVLVAAILAAIGFYFRAQNSNTAHKDVAQIQSIDKAGGQSGTERTDLKNFVQSHLGASVKFTLTASYNRALAQAQAATAAQATASSTLYAAAQRACSGHTDSITQANCNTAYIQAHQTAVNLAPIPTPKVTSYQYAFSSPFWAPDLAGAFFLGAAVALVFSLFMEQRSG
jgi:ABC-type phosphate/phosphonate transport system substrate-binding protein